MDGFHQHLKLDLGKLEIAL